MKTILLLLALSIPCFGQSVRMHDTYHRAVEARQMAEQVQRQGEALARLERQMRWEAMCAASDAEEARFRARTPRPADPRKKR